MASIFTGRRRKTERCRVLDQKAAPGMSGFQFVIGQLAAWGAHPTLRLHGSLKVPASKRQVGEFAASGSDTAVLSVPRCSVSAQINLQQDSRSPGSSWVPVPTGRSPHLHHSVWPERGPGRGPGAAPSGLLGALPTVETHVVPFCSCTLASNGPRYYADLCRQSFLSIFLKITSLLTRSAHFHFFIFHSGVQCSDLTPLIIK